MTEDRDVDPWIEEKKLRKRNAQPAFLAGVTAIPDHAKKANFKARVAASARQRGRKITLPTKPFKVEK